MRAPTQRCGRRSRRAARRRCLPRSCARDLWLRRRAGVTARRSVVSRKSAPPGGGERPRTRKSPANAGLSLMRRRGLEPPPGYPGPGPQPGNPGVRSVLCVHIVQNVRVAGRIGRNGRSGCCHGCCHGPEAFRANGGAGLSLRSSRHRGPSPTAAYGLSVLGLSSAPMYERHRDRTDDEPQDR